MTNGDKQFIRYVVMSYIFNYLMLLYIDCDAAIKARLLLFSPIGILFTIFFFIFKIANELLVVLERLF